MTFNIAAVSRSSHKGLSDQKQKDSGSRCATRSSPKGLSDQEAKDSGKSKCKVLTVLQLRVSFLLCIVWSNVVCMCSLHLTLSHESKVITMVMTFDPVWHTIQCSK